MKQTSWQSSGFSWLFCHHVIHKTTNPGSQIMPQMHDYLNSAEKKNRDGKVNLVVDWNISSDTYMLR